MDLCLLSGRLTDARPYRLLVGPGDGLRPQEQQDQSQIGQKQYTSLGEANSHEAKVVLEREKLTPAR